VFVAATPLGHGLSATIEDQLPELVTVMSPAEQMEAMRSGVAIPRIIKVVLSLGFPSLERGVFI
jgi:hypothetical protein